MFMNSTAKMLDLILNPESKNFADTAAVNTLTFLDYYKRLRLLALSMFEWFNLPESMNARFLEQTLFCNGIAAFCHDENLGFLSLPCMQNDYLNVYNESLTYKIYSVNYEKTFPRDEIVLVRNNLESIPTNLTVEMFARRLANAERTIDVNINAQKTPVLVKCPEKQRLTMKNVYMNFDGNSPVIYGDKDLDLDGLKVFKTDAPFIADKLQEYKRNVWSEALSFLGVNNVAFEKGERLLSDEVNANNQSIQLSAQTMLLTRQKAANDFNLKWGGNISVKLRSFSDMNITPETAAGKSEV